MIALGVVRHTSVQYFNTEYETEERELDWKHVVNLSYTDRINMVTLNINIASNSWLSCFIDLSSLVVVLSHDGDDNDDGD